MSNNNNKPYQHPPPPHYYPQNYPPQHPRPQQYSPHPQYPQYPYHNPYLSMPQHQQNWSYYPYQQMSHTHQNNQHQQQPAYPYPFPPPNQQVKPAEAPRKEFLNNKQTPSRKFASNRRETPNKQIDSDQLRGRASDNSDVSSQYSSEEQVEAFYKKRPIARRRDPVLDSKEQIRKWIEARKKNYPRRNKQEEGTEEQPRTNQGEMSLLQKKIRKKLILINSDPRSIIKKQKDLDILRRFILYPRRPRKSTYRYQKYEEKQGKQLVEQIEPKQLEAEPEKEQTQLVSLKEIPYLQEEKNVEGTLLGDKDKERDQQDDAGQPEEAEEVPIDAGNHPPEKQKEMKVQVRQAGRGRKEELSVDVIIKHLQMKQNEDSQLLENFMDYKSNSFHYRYQYQTLETNLLLDNIFRDTSYMLQAIRYIVKNNFFQ